MEILFLYRYIYWFKTAPSVYIRIYIPGICKSLWVQLKTSLEVQLIHLQYILHEFMTLSCDDLKISLRSTNIHIWCLHRHFTSKINICNNTRCFQSASIVIEWKYHVFHILIENDTLGGHVYKTGIWNRTLGQLKIPSITAAV